MDSLCKHILQLLEEALALFVVFLFQGALKFLQGLTLGLVQPLWVPSGTVYSTLPSMEGTVMLSPRTAWL